MCPLHVKYGSASMHYSHTERSVNYWQLAYASHMNADNVMHKMAVILKSELVLDPFLWLYF